MRAHLSLHYLGFELTKWLIHNLPEEHHHYHLDKGKGALEHGQQNDRQMNYIDSKPS